MARKYYKVKAIVTDENGRIDVITSVQINTSIIGAIKDMEKMAERSGIRKVEVIRAVNLEYDS